MIHFKLHNSNLHLVAERVTYAEKSTRLVHVSSCFNTVVPQVDCDILHCCGSMKMMYSKGHIAETKVSPMTNHLREAFLGQGRLPGCH